MRICILNEFFYPDETGGTGTVLSGLARTLRDNYPGVEIDVITSRHQYRAKEKLAPQETWDGISISRLPSPRPFVKSTVVRLAINLIFGLLTFFVLLFRSRYDLILVGTAPPTLAMAAQWIHFLKRTPYVYVIYDLEPDRAVSMKVISPKNPVVRLLHRLQYGWLHTSSKAVVLGRCMQDHLMSAYNLPREHIEVIPIGANPNEIVPMPKATRFRTDQKLDGFVVVYSGNFGRYHNFDTILDAASELRERRKDITFILVGNGYQKAHIQSRVHTEQMDNVRIFPFLPKQDYADLLASADVSLVTLEPGMEGLCVPSKFYSILAAGRATIAIMSKTCEVARVIEEANCGVQINQKDTQQLIEALHYLADHPEVTEQMGENARAVLMKRFTSQRIAEQYYRTFVGATGQRVDEAPVLFAQTDVELRR